MRSRRWLILVPSALIASVAALMPYPLPHANYEEAENIGASTRMLLSAILSPWSLETGLLENASRVLRLAGLLLPEPLNERLSGLLNLTIKVQEHLREARELLEECDSKLNSSLLEEAEDLLARAESELVECNATLVKVRVVVLDLVRSYPVARDLVEPRLDALEKTVDLAWMYYRRLRESYDEMLRALLVESRITINLDRGVVKPGEYVKADGLASSLEGEPLSGIVEVDVVSGGSVHSRRVVKVEEGVYELLLEAPMIPGSYTVIATFKPEAGNVRGSRSEPARLVVEPYTTLMNVSCMSECYPGSEVVIWGSVTAVVDGGYLPSGILRVEAFGKVLESMVRGNFTVRVGVPYYVEPGEYSAKIAFKPFSKAFSKQSLSLLVKVVEPPYKSRLLASKPLVVLSGLPLKVSVEVVCSRVSRFKLLVVSERGAMAIAKAYSNTPLEVEVPMPVDAWSGIHEFELLAIPLDPQVKYSRYTLRVVVLNTPSLLTVLIGGVLTALTLLRLPLRGVSLSRAIKAARRLEKLTAERSLTPVRVSGLRGLFRALVNRAEALACSMLGVRVKVSDTHREILWKIREKGWPHVGLLTWMVKMFERVYYGLKEVGAEESSAFKRAYVRIVVALKGGERGG